MEIETFSFLLTELVRLVTEIFLEVFVGAGIGTGVGLGVGAFVGADVAFDTGFCVACASGLLTVSSVFTGVEFSNPAIGVESTWLSAVGKSSA